MCCLCQLIWSIIYLQSIARTPISRLPWLIRTYFWVSPIFLFLAQVKKLKEIVLFYHELYVVCTHKNRLIEAILMSTLNIPLLSKQSLSYRHLPPDVALWLTLSDSNYAYLEQIYMAPKMIVLLRFDLCEGTYLEVYSHRCCFFRRNLLNFVNMFAYLIRWLWRH